MIILTIISVFILIFSVLIFVKISSFNSVKKNQELKDEILQDIKENFEKIENLIEKNFIKNSQENNFLARNNREEINNSFKNFNESILQNFSNLAKIQGLKIDEFSKGLQNFEEKSIRNLVENRNELTKNLGEFDKNQKLKFEEFFVKNEKMKSEIEQKLDLIRTSVENKLTYLQEDNNKKLEQMRLTVDEKLQETVEKRFDQSFKIVSEQLNQVHKDFGEMRNLASGVGDLKKVLSNVKTRGNIGEIQLGAIIEQYFSSAQYEKNAAIKDGSQRVEYAIKIPSKNSDDQMILLPIDSKFPIEDYQRLSEAYENIDAVNQQATKSEIEIAKRQFESAVKKAAKEIHDKYLNPPKTTDFGVMFVPTEGLYAEILKNNNLFEDLQKNYRVVVLGPTTIVAFLSALQMGFRTLEIEKKSSEVWNVLNKVKTDFSKFGIYLEKAKKKIQEASNSIDNALTKKRTVERDLKGVKEISESSKKLEIENSQDLISLVSQNESDEDDS